MSLKLKILLKKIHFQKLNDENKITLSAKFLSENLSALMNNLVNEMFDFTQYSITDDDCLAIDLNAIRTNEFKSIQIEVCDLPINNTEIAINLDKIRFIQNTHKHSMKFPPTREFSSSEEFSSTREFSYSSCFSKELFAESSLFTFESTPTQTNF